MSKINEREIPNILSIVAYMHCGKCLAELPGDISPRDYGSYEVGWTDLGLQVWCKRHEYNIVHADFCGNKIVINSTAVE